MHAALLLAAALGAGPFAMEPAFPSLLDLGALHSGLLRSIAVSGVVRRDAQGLTHEEARAKVGALLGGSVPAGFIDAAFADPATRVIDGLEDYFNHAPEHNGTYEQYRAIFMTEGRIAAGAKFVADNNDLLAAVEKRFGVDPGLVASFVGVETFYGRSTGKFDVFNALYTITRKVPSRSDWAARELAEYLKYCRADGSAVHAVAGSYAGAFGFGQFMPSSANAYAVDFDGDGRRNLFSWPDASASVANYVARHGYEPGASFAEGSANWRAIWSYNHSEFYVRVVIELRQAILARRGPAA